MLFYDSFISLLEAGWVLWPLLVCLFLILWGCSQRFLLFRDISRRTPEFAVYFHRAETLVQPTRVQLQEIFQPLCQQLKAYRVMIVSLTALAPLLGLLGTVEGMIETFDSLGGMQMYTSSGGIAAGISQALVSTQVGLMIAVPGYIMARSLNQKEQQLLALIEQFQNRLILGGGQ